MPRPVGSVITTASAGSEASMAASAPLPLHSSSTTHWSSTRARGRRPSARSPRTAATNATSPAFMSAAPRP